MPRPRSRVIPTFALYGEAHAAPGPEFAHIEDIAARSHPRNWEIKPHIHAGLAQVLFVREGRIAARLDGGTAEAAGPAAVVVPANAIHAFRFAPETQGFVLTVAAAALADADFEALLARPALIDFKDAETDARRVSQLLDQIAAEWQWAGGRQTQMIGWLVRCIAILLIRRGAGGSGTDPTRRERGRAAVFARFRGLVDRHYRDHWPVAAYAEALGLTPGRLDRICRQFAGDSAFGLIQARLLLEAQRKLAFLAAPIGPLADELGFSDASYFARFFKRRTGMTPAAYRRGRGG